MGLYSIRLSLSRFSGQVQQQSITHDEPSFPAFVEGIQSCAFLIRTEYGISVCEPPHFWLKEKLPWGRESICASVGGPEVGRFIRIVGNARDISN